MNKRLFPVLFVIFTVLTACESTQQASPETNSTSGTLTISGSSTIAPLASELAKAFEKQHPGARVDVQSGGSSRGIADVRRGISDIGMVSRQLGEKEKDLQGHLLAIDGIAMIAHKTNHVNKVSTEQVRNIYTGKTRNWRKLGGKNETITVINKAEGRSTLEVFLKYFNLKNSDIKPDTVIGDNEQGIKLVTGNKNAIAYVSIGTAEYYVNQNANLKLLDIDNIQASTISLLQKNYPLSRELNFITKQQESPLATRFLSFALSSRANAHIEGQYFVPVSR